MRTSRPFIALAAAALAACSGERTVVMIDQVQLAGDPGKADSIYGKTIEAVVLGEARVQDGVPLSGSVTVGTADASTVSFSGNMIVVARHGAQYFEAYTGVKRFIAQNLNIEIPAFLLYARDAGTQDWTRFDPVSVVPAFGSEYAINYFSDVWVDKQLIGVDGGDGDWDGEGYYPADAKGASYASGDRDVEFGLFPIMADALVRISDGKTYDYAVHMTYTPDTSWL